MPPAALLDVDGTLVDSNYEHVVAWSIALREHGVTVPQWQLHRAVGMGGDQFIAHVAGSQVESSMGDALRARHDDLFLERIGRVAPLPGAGELIAALGDAGHEVVFASSAKGEEVDVYLDLLGVRGAVQWTTSSDVEATKPAPDLVAAARAKAGPGPAVLVGDTRWDVEAAARAGIPAIGLLSGGIGADELREAGAAIVLRDAVELRERLAETPLAG